MNFDNSNKTIRGSTTLNYNEAEHLSPIKQSMPVNGGFNSSRTNYGATFRSLPPVVSPPEISNTDENFKVEYLTSENETENNEWNFAIILIIFSLSIFIGIFYVSSKNITTKYTNIKVPINVT